MAPTTVTTATTIDAHLGFNPELSIASATHAKTSVLFFTNVVTSSSSPASSTTQVTKPQWMTGYFSFRDLSVWAYFALGVIIIAAAIVLGYAIYSCCRMAVRVERVPLSTGDGETGNAAGDGGGDEDGNEKLLGRLVTTTPNPHVNATRNRTQDHYGVVINVNHVNKADPRADSSAWLRRSEMRKKRFGVVDFSVRELFNLAGWSMDRQGSKEMKKVTPPRLNRNRWHANDDAKDSELAYSYPYALDYESTGNPCLPPPVYVRHNSHQNREKLWKNLKLSPVGGSLIA